MAKKTSNQSLQKAKAKPEHSPLSVKLQMGDVLLGRGSGVSRHPGNIRFRLLVKLYKEEYNKTIRQEKMVVAEKIVKELRTMTPPGRFLEKQSERSNRFVCVQDRVAVEKTAQALRERKWSPFSRSEAFATLKGLNAKLMQEKNPNAFKEPTVPNKKFAPKPIPKGPPPKPSSKGKVNANLKLKPQPAKKGTTAKKPLPHKSKPMVKAAKSKVNPEYSAAVAAATLASAISRQNLWDGYPAYPPVMMNPNMKQLAFQTGSFAPPAPPLPTATPATPKIAALSSSSSVKPLTTTTAAPTTTTTLKLPKPEKEPVTPGPRGKFRRLDRIVNEALQQEFDLYLAHLPPTIYEAYYLAHFAAEASTTPHPPAANTAQQQQEGVLHVVDPAELDDERSVITL